MRIKKEILLFIIVYLFLFFLNSQYESQKKKQINKPDKGYIMWIMIILSEQEKAI